jgi:hypothetical protein
MPVAFGAMTTNTLKLASYRAGTKGSNSAFDAGIQSSKCHPPGEDSSPENVTGGAPQGEAARAGRRRYRRAGREQHVRAHPRFLLAGHSHQAQYHSPLICLVFPLF